MLDFIQTVAIIILAAVIIYKLKPLQAMARRPMLILDSCALIDGRVVELAKAGFLPYQLLVPQFIIAELQLLADGSDSHKRERARFGLEIVQQLQNEASVSLSINEQPIQAKTTDEKLVKLAKKIGADLFTTDFNLNQVASIEGVKVLNINELSHAMRPVALPGEAFSVKIIQAGSNRDQGVGYLEDGTMIVVDGAQRDIGKSVAVTVTRTHQTVAGKMIFAQKVAAAQQQSPSQTKKTQPNSPRASAQTNASSKRTDRRPSYRATPRPNRAEAGLFDAINKQQ